LSVLSPLQAYRLWAPRYRGESAFCVFEDQLVTSLMPSPQGRRLLDVGCGTGLRLKDCNAALAFGVDASPEMLAASGLRNVAAGDIRALPFPTDFFDLVWCRLMMAYLPDLRPGYAELARVCRRHGQVMVSDFHADATRAGHRQTFRDAQGDLHEIAHYAYDASSHRQAATSANLSLLAHHDGLIGPQIQPLCERGGHMDMYERDLGLAIVALFLFEKT